MKCLWNVVGCIVIGLPAYVKADFFAFRTLQHPVHKDVVYLLYDAHASIEKDPLLNQAIEEKLLRDIWDNVQDPKNNSIEKAYKAFFNGLDQIDARESIMINEQLPNLIRQQTDLVNVVRNDHMSIITEDWPYPIRNLLSLREAELHKYANKVLGSQDKYEENVFRLYTSPLRNMGKKILGKFTQLKLNVIPGADTYFYNPDSRATGAGYQVSDRAIDGHILTAIKKLARDYHQKSIIVAAGYSHSVAVAHDLVEKEGYVAGPLIISVDLARKRATHARVNTFLLEVEANNVSFVQKYNLKNEDIYALIADPLDIKKVFADQLLREGIEERSFSKVEIAIKNGASLSEQRLQQVQNLLSQTKREQEQKAVDLQTIIGTLSAP